MPARYDFHRVVAPGGSRPEKRWGPLSSRRSTPATTPSTLNVRLPLARLDLDLDLLRGYFELSWSVWRLCTRVLETCSGKPVLHAADWPACERVLRATRPRRRVQVLSRRNAFSRSAALSARSCGDGIGLSPLPDAWLDLPEAGTTPSSFSSTCADGLERAGGSSPAECAT